MLIKIFKLLTNKEKFYFTLMVLFLFFGMILEFASIGLLIPFLSVILKGANGLLKFDFFKRYEDIIISNELFLINYGIILIISFFVFKYIYLALLNFYQLKFSASIMKRLGAEIITNYLKGPYLKIKNSNQTNLINNIYKQVEVFIANGFEPLIVLISEIFIILGIFIFLFFYDSKTVILLFLFLVTPSLIFYLIVKSKSKKLGFLNKKYDDYILQNISDILKSIKEIKIYQKYDEFLLSFKNNYLHLTKTRQRKLFLNQLPRYFIEMLLVISICIILFAGQSSKNEDEIIIFLGVFVLAAFRILPSLNKIIIHLQVLAFAKTSLKNIHDHKKLKFENIDDDGLLNENFNFLEIKNISFSYGENKIFNNINFIIKKNKINGIVGKSGSGKSTLLDLIIGLNKSCNGAILYNGEKNIYNFRGQWQKKVGYVPQSFSLINDTIEKNISLTLNEKKINNELIQKVLEISELKEIIQRLPHNVKSKIGDSGSRLSGGQKQRIVIARALYSNPEILILDESTSALDNKTEKNIFKNIRTHYPNLTIIVVSHNLTTLKYCDEILSLDDLNDSSKF